MSAGPSPDTVAPRPLPDFVGIGALKAGTTYLDAMLRTHPQLSLPPHVKEVDFFNRHHERGLQWYSAQFAADDGRLRGEISPQYFFDAETPTRIAAANPATRLLVSVRNPVSRTFSQYRHWVQETGYQGGFETFLGEHPGAVERSNYWRLLERYRAVFADEQIHVVVFEQMTAQPLPVLQDVFTFLGVDSGHVPASLDEAVNVSGTPRFPRLYVQSKKVSRYLYDHGAGSAVDRVKATGAGRALRGGATSGRSAGATRPSEDVAAKLAAGFREDAAALSDHLGRDLLVEWSL